MQTPWYKRSRQIFLPAGPSIPLLPAQSVKISVPPHNFHHHAEIYIMFLAADTILCPETTRNTPGRVMTDGDVWGQSLST